MPICWGGSGFVLACCNAYYVSESLRFDGNDAQSAVWRVTGCPWARLDFNVHSCCQPGVVNVCPLDFVSHTVRDCLDVKRLFAPCVLQESSPWLQRPRLS